MPKPVMLAILDGFGWNEEPGGQRRGACPQMPHFRTTLGQFAARLPGHLRRASSACPPGRWAIPRSATSISAPGGW